MNRTAIYVYYDKEGIIHNDALWQLAELKRNVNYLIVVINGNLVGDVPMREYADEIIYRENTGFDAAAYKAVITDLGKKAIIESCDELVLCNNSFYGPFCSFEPIFEKMSGNDVDFWGMAYLEYGFFRCIESFFMVFRKNILQNQDLQNYFRDHIAYDTDDFTSICLAFEHGLFECLVDKGYKFDAYSNSKHWIHRDVLEIIKVDGLPVLKKKAFSQKYYDEKRMLDALRYISEKFDYDIDYILDNEKTGSEIKSKLAETDNVDYKLRVIPLPKSREKIRSFLRENGAIYIYGYGLFSRYIVDFLADDETVIKGFVVSDGQNTKAENPYGAPVYNISQLRKELDAPILVALNEENTMDVQGGLVGFSNIFYIWESVQDI